MTITILIGKAHQSAPVATKDAVVVAQAALTGGKIVAETFEFGSLSPAPTMSPSGTPPQIQPLPANTSPFSRHAKLLRPTPTQPVNRPNHDSANQPTQPPPATATHALAAYAPKQAVALAHPTNYGERMRVDVYGKPVHNALLVVLHETVGSAASAVSFFQTPHYKDAEQASYHTLIDREGTIVYIVPPEKRAYGAGNSVFEGPNGPEAVITKIGLPASVNNFAYHIALETPPDGFHNGASHSGYTDAQYQSLAWLVAQTGVPLDRITTHAAVDRSGERQDPRSFDRDRFLTQWQFYTRQLASAMSPNSGSNGI
ncbi:N-acetylmuramoyl-L-alanine amidase [Trichothermofontia sichuanensis B231]|uniref:N-acetylmuramoyl-L-alanine amidase n=1 Tax=Trichothermofontia sichuanensis TaxID=3045816 RepID=UPI0022455F12|nr:N-acetylmuramoyl-L-alanine amidase [Trichothermofontia sichuanensis]UZQ54664.1 N-acetylmuramoyl-L-alanine amidase [Trichothermofontia sichuanensis B231]